jgi:hypothetical protein
VIVRYGRIMRWDNLFDDLESQLEQELDAEQLDLLAEEERLRLGRLSLRDRIMTLTDARSGGGSAPIRVTLTSGVTLPLLPTTFGKDWLAADVSGAHPPAQCVLPLAAIASVSLTPAQVEASLEPGTVAAAGGQPGTGRFIDRIGLPFVLRDLCRRRASLELVTTSGTVHGTIDRVGRDHLDLAVHEPGSSRRAANVTDQRMIPLETILLVRV